jgi:hypothetical protein
LRKCLGWGEEQAQPSEGSRCHPAPLRQEGCLGRKSAGLSAVSTGPLLSLVVGWEWLGEASPKGLCWGVSHLHLCSRFPRRQDQFASVAIAEVTDPGETGVHRNPLCPFITTANCPQRTGNAEMVLCLLLALVQSVIRRLPNSLCPVEDSMGGHHVNGVH